MSLVLSSYAKLPGGPHKYATGAQEEGLQNKERGYAQREEGGASAICQGGLFFPSNQVRKEL